MDRDGPRPTDDKTSVAIDPTRQLYWWEGQYGEADGYDAVGPSKQPRLPILIQVEIVEASVVRLPHPVSIPTNKEGIIRPQQIPFFRVHVSVQLGPGIELHIPLYEPCTQHELQLIELLRDAFNKQRKVTMEYRESVFFGPYNVITGVTVFP